MTRFTFLNGTANFHRKSKKNHLIISFPRCRSFEATEITRESGTPCFNQKFLLSQTLGTQGTWYLRMKQKAFWALFTVWAAQGTGVWEATGGELSPDVILTTPWHKDDVQGSVGLPDSGAYKAPTIAGETKQTSQTHSTTHGSRNAPRSSSKHLISLTP